MLVLFRGFGCNSVRCCFFLRAVVLRVRHRLELATIAIRNGNHIHIWRHKVVIHT